MVRKGPEARFQAKVVKRAKQLGWTVFYPPRSKWVLPGWPDLTLNHRILRYLLFVELKTDDGEVSIEQSIYQYELNLISEHIAESGGDPKIVRAIVVAESDWPKLESLLERPDQNFVSD